MSRTRKNIRITKSILRSLIKSTPVQVNVLPSYRCNLDCSYCYRNSTGSPEMSFEDFKIVVKKAEELSAGYFAFAGGEPLLWKSLIDAISFLTEKNFASYISSNGFPLEDKMNLERQNLTF